MTDIILNDKNNVEHDFINTFDAVEKLCGDIKGEYSVSKSFMGVSHHNSCIIGKAKILGWRDGKRIDVWQGGFDFIRNIDKIHIHQRANHTTDAVLLWGAEWVTKGEEGLHGDINIGPEGITSIGVNEFKKGTDSPIFTVYTG